MVYMAVYQFNVKYNCDIIWVVMNISIILSNAGANYDKKKNKSTLGPFY